MFFLKIFKNITVVKETIKAMRKRNLYTVTWLDDDFQPYETLEDLTYKQMVHCRQQAKFYHLDIRVKKQTQE